MLHRWPRVLAVLLLLPAGCLSTGAVGDGGLLDLLPPADLTADMPAFNCPEPPPRPTTVAPAQVTRGTTAGRYLLRGRVVTPDQVLVDGEVLVADGMIGCVAQSCSASALGRGATVIDTGGVIFPGLVDAHNHTQFNYLPPWVPPPGVHFVDRYQWQSNDDYRLFVESVNANEGDFVCQQVKYGEVRALVGGTTTMQGTFSNPRRCFRTLVRNAEYGDFGDDRMRTHIGKVGDIFPQDARDIAAQMRSGEVTAYVIHLAEGIDDLSRVELDMLAGLDLLQPATVIIHGTALGAPELMRVQAAGAKLVWSPLSNLALYGGTTDVPTARALGIPVALAPDWTPSGSASLLHELRVAQRHDCQQWGSTLDPKTLVSMVTSVPAQVLALDAQVGRLASGLFADLLVIADRGEDAYQTLIHAQLDDVRLVMIGGDVRYGDVELLSASARTACEPMRICGKDKFLCVPDNTDGTDSLDQSFEDIRNAIQGFYPTPYTLEVCDG